MDEIPKLNKIMVENIKEKSQRPTEQFVYAFFFFHNL